MNLGPKIALWVGIAFVALGSSLVSQIMFSIGVSDMVVPPSHLAITLGVAMIVGALVAWKR